MQDVVSDILSCNIFQNLLLQDRLGFKSEKGQKPKYQVVDALNDVLFSKTVRNKFITVQDVVFIIFLYCNSIPEFVA